MTAMNALLDALLLRVLWTSIQAIGLIGVVYLLARWLPQLSASMRCTLWWLVGAQLLLGLLWHAPLELHLLSATSVTAAASVAQPAAYATTAAVDHPAVLHASTMAAASASATAISWRAVVVIAWLSILLWQALRMLREWRAARQIVRHSLPVRDQALQALCRHKARQLGLRGCPRLRVSDAISSPQVIGLWHPTILMPAHTALSPDESAMALAHELVHVRRGDLWLGWVPALAQWLFCFHPVVQWAMREYALNRESACDAQVVQHDLAAPHDYGRLLLRLGVAKPVHAGLAGASPSFHNLKRRLTMLQQTVNQPPSRARGWLLVVAIALFGVLPYRVTAAGSQSSTHAPLVAGAALASPVPAAPQRSDAVMPPAPPLPPRPPMSPPVPPPPPLDPGFSARHVSIDTTNDAATGFALFDGNTAITINGSNADLDTVKKLHATNKSMLWFRRGNEAYLIRDTSMLERASRIYAPVTALARQQGELAGQQGAIAGQQAGLAAQEAAFAQRQAALAGQQAELAGRVASRAATGVDQSTEQRRLDARQAQTDAAQAQLEKGQAELDTRLAAQRQLLERQQDGFDKRQQAIDKQQQRAQHTAEQSMSHLLDEALARGLAQKTSLH